MLHASNFKSTYQTRHHNMKQPQLNRQTHTQTLFQSASAWFSVPKNQLKKHLQTAELVLL